MEWWLASESREDPEGTEVSFSYVGSLTITFPALAILDLIDRDNLADTGLIIDGFPWDN